MRRLILATAVATTALAGPALARNDSWYVQADAGGNWIDDFQVYEDAAPNQLNAPLDSAVAQVGTRMGYDFGGVVGYDFGLFRVEGEASYRRAGVNGLQTFNVSAPATGLSGHGRALGVMANALFDVGADETPQFFAGGGVGFASTRLQAAGTTGETSTFTLDGSKDGFAWQLLAGVRFPLSKALDLGLKYRFFNQDLDLTGTQRTTGTTVSVQSDPLHTRWRSHSAMLTLGYNFGAADTPPPAPPAPPLPPPPPPMPPAPPPPPPPVCNKGPYIVFFDWDKADITSEAASILDSAVTAYGSCASVPIMLAGYTDRSGSTNYNQGLSERRNASVRAYLTAHGVPDGAISAQGFGESNNRVPTADGVRELQNRRVEITYGPGSGM